MSESARHAPSQTSSEPSTAEELRADIDKNRHELADSVNAVSSRLNVTAQATHTMQEAKARAGHTLTRAGDAVGRAKQKAPEPAQKALDATGKKLSPLLHRSIQTLAPVLRQGTAKVKAYRKQLPGAAAALVAARFAVRRRTGKDHSS